MVPLPLWLRVLGAVYVVARAALLVGLAVALGGVVAYALTEPPDEPVFTSFTARLP